ncbi:CAP domain-containing protein [Halosimplex sp. TS25]|uniref:CAP domain-containing protein n=1 Tax=Halosimplex rarum TaxID=3396619 RepID=UPI0039E98D3F
MYWGQVVVALMLAASGAYTAYVRGWHAIEAALFGVVFYFLIRWFIAWAYRIRYWYHRGTRGVYTEYCTNCNQRRHRLSGDWILTCRRCGWKPGWYGIRWLTKSLPAQQLRRTVVGPQLLVAVAVIGVLATGAASGLMLGDLSVAIPEDRIQTDNSDRADSTHISAEDTQHSKGGAGSGGSKLNETRVEQLVFDYVNAKRGLRGMENYTTNLRAGKAARQHAVDMAENEYFSHTSLDGETQQERYSFCDGGENAAQTWANKEIRQNDGEIVSYSTERELARGIVTQWMNSDPHRERGIYGEWWTSAGVGIAITSDGKVYAVMGFCSN